MPRNTSVLPASGPQHAAARPGSRPPRIIDRALTRLVTIGVAAVALLSVTSPASAAPTIYVGAVGDVATLSKQTGSPLAWPTYSEFPRNAPTGADMISVRSPGVSWRQVANASAGSAIHNNIVRWAQTVKSRGPIMIAFHHEPEAKGSTGYGTSADFIAAYRKVVDIFNAQGATNVHWVWQMTDYAFRVPATDRRAAPKWYPGDAYVDNVGADGYNWG